jgi:hypothetical protein
VEFGNALYQDIADRYVSGKEVSAADLSQVWRNHTNPIMFDSPVYEQLFKTVREVNQTLPEGKRWRILLGDPRDAYWNELNRRHLIMWGTPLDASKENFNTHGRYYVKPR